MAGATEAAIWITPSERLKILRQSMVNESKPIHTGLVSSVQIILKDQGIAGVYRGLWPTVFRNSLSIGLRFAMYGQINRMICAWRGSKIKGFWDPLFSGAFVGGITTILNNPIDVVKSRMQADSAGTGSGRMYKSTSHCIKAVFVEFGVLGFMSGLRARILKVSIGQAVIFFTYEHARTLVTRFI